MSKNPTISLRSQWLGDRLKRARRRAGMTLQEIAEQMQVADTTLGRFEKGTVRIRRPYVKEMINFYGISKRSERDALLQLNEDAWRKDWWEGDTSDLETEFLDYTWLEARATNISQYESMLVPGLLQTRSYARAVIENGASASAEMVDRSTELRMARQRMLFRENPVRLSVVLDEAVLRRPIGGAETLTDQLFELIAMATRPNILLRVVMLSTGWHPGTAGSFTLFDLNDPYPGVAYVENLAGRTFIEDEARVDQFRAAYDELDTRALDPQASIELIRTLAKEQE